ncbi:MAG: biopolymer transporter ExbD [Deltaproteobacteria bacterium]|nr:biopolymer transporter ExbD [Deltaproteobacteria bacterium]MBI3296193.1 biopolymer transporter ExbD [Deltaproteobacteria bacterium]
MANKPSARTHRMKPLEGLNLTPMIDMVTNLMFFLMMFASVMPVVMIDAPLPKVASTADEIKQAKKDENKQELAISINAQGISVRGVGGSKSFPLGVDGKYPTKELHAYLVGLHTKRPTDHEITLLPSDEVPYEVMISVMDASRELESGDPGYQAVPPDVVHKPESAQFNRLFPDVSIGGV